MHPRPFRFGTIVKGSMIGLPHRVGMGRLSPIEQIKLLMENRPSSCCGSEQDG